MENDVTTSYGRSQLALSGAQMATVKRTVAHELNDQEFDLFMEASKSYGLNPFLQQVNAILFNKTDAAKRRMVISVGIGGLRSIAQRCGDYRPASKQSHKEIDEKLIGPCNPKGLEYISVVLFKQDSKGEWFEVYGEAYWDEFAPISDEWDYDQQKGKRAPTGRKTLTTTGQWGAKPIVMLEKCATARALRAGWPDVFSGIYSEEELDADRMRDVTPSEAVEVEQKERREAAIEMGHSILMVFGQNNPFERIQIGDLADRCFEFIEQSSQKDVYIWKEQNVLPLREFWAQSPSDALGVKAAIEKKLSKFDIMAETETNGSDGDDKGSI